MKKMFFVLLTCIAFINAKGQNQITIQNAWQCTAYIDFTAVCPDDDCNEYSSGHMVPLPHAPTGLVWSPSWFPSPPPCSNWVWDHADIVFFCDGNPYAIRVGNKNSLCNLNDDYTAFTIPQDCADACFGGKTLVQVSWTQLPNGDVHVIIW